MYTSAEKKNDSEVKRWESYHILW